MAVPPEVDMTSARGRHYSSWIDSRLQYVVRLEFYDGSTTELTYVHETAAARQRARDSSGHIRHGYWILRSTAMRGSIRQRTQRAEPLK